MAIVLHGLSRNDQEPHDLRTVTGLVDQIASLTPSTKSKTVGDLTICFPDEGVDQYDKNCGFAFSSSGFFRCIQTNVEAIERIVASHNQTIIKIYDRGKRGHSIEEHEFIGFGSSGTECDIPRALREKSLEQQLKDIGFVELSNGVFEYISKDPYGYDVHNIFAIEAPYKDKGVLLQGYKSNRVGSNSLFQEGTKLVTIEHHRNDKGEYETNYVFANNKALFITQKKV